ncbi:MAG: HAD-IC family P-type ATPase [Ktedonobacteraceae bacterium]|nr:HAD-IC family P-type ATPase [Ktedonobacteraceae bacterium]
MGIQQQTLIRGLSTAEVEERRARGLSSVPPPATGRSYLQIIRENVFNTINNILFSIALALVLLGQYLDALISVGVVSFNMVISLIQELRAKRTLDRISLLARPSATVLRDGREQQVAPEELVVDDILVVRAGDQIVADGPVVGEGRIEVDESLLTGESEPVSKQPGDRLYSGTFCVTGSTLYRAEKVGVQSMAGTLTAGARAHRETHTPLQREINLIIRVLLLIALFLEFLLAAASVANFIPVVETMRMAMVIIGIVPNGLILSISVAYALGAVRIAGKGALVQRFNAIESLSHVDVLCTDKTGTLTTNALELAALHPCTGDETILRTLLGSYVAHTTSRNATSDAIGAACQAQAQRRLHVREEIPFSSARKWSALTFDDATMRGTYILGAPEMLLPHLTAGTALDELDMFIATQTGQGLRVLLFAHVPHPTTLQSHNGATHLPDGLLPLGAIALRDTLRAEAYQTLKRFRDLGVQIKILSGDHPHTVAALAKQVGLNGTIKTVSGTDLDRLDEAQLIQVAEATTIFGRITPQQKERLVRALRHRGHYVAMIGDGINDVLSLKQANLGISMQSGSQATRGAADLILLNDTFASLPLAVREGQRIRNGMQDILKLFLTRIASVTLLLISIAFIGGFPFQPRQTSLLTFFTVGVPALALAYWARPGRGQDDGLLGSLLRFVLPTAMTTCLVAIIVYLAVFLPAYLAHPHPANPLREGALPLAQTALTVFTVLCGLIVVLFVKPPGRSRPGQQGDHGNWRPTLLVLLLFACFLGILATPPLRELFNLQALDLLNYTVISGATLLWTLLMLLIWRFHLFERFFQLQKDALPGEEKSG